ncbi:MAG: phosphatidylglycerophosphatase A [Campylobacterota bacterium]|nr:phosphatidylglycerophosphatase A [Campylobacterota bacterium]
MNMRKFFLTVGYSGLSPKAPGTVGSFVSLLIALALLPYVHLSTLFLLALLITVIAVKQIDIYEKDVGIHDGKEIVIDELAGMWIALSISGATTDNWLIPAILSFMFFRLFDIWKPSIIGKIDRNVKGGWGVMGDDLLAGIFGGICAAAIYGIYLNF